MSSACRPGFNQKILQRPSGRLVRSQVLRHPERRCLSHRDEHSAALSGTLVQTSAAAPRLSRLPLPQRYKGYSQPPLAACRRPRADPGGPHGSAWFGHHDGDGKICGWEERGSQWRGFSSGGTKVLFRFGSRTAVRLCITEAAIGALSLAAIERKRFDTLYASTAGGWSPATELAVRNLAGRIEILVAASDRNSQGEAYADTLRRIAGRADCGFRRLRPRLEDWNENLTENGAGFPYGA
jgi:hypothetical protein